MNAVNITNYTHQKGFVLVTGVLFLLVLTILGITSMNSSIVTEKMTHNMKDRTASFQASEIALSDGESWVKNQSTVPSTSTSCNNPPCSVWQYDSTINFIQRSDTWWQSQGRPFSSTLANVYAQPYFYIEQIAYVPYDLNPETANRGFGYYYYRITSYGKGISSSSSTLLQSIYATQFN